MSRPGDRIRNFLSSDTARRGVQYGLYGPGQGFGWSAPGKGTETRYFRSNVSKLALFAVLTAGLYAGFFVFVDFDFFTDGTVLGALGVVVAALLFSAVHGGFANYLLEVVGLRPQEK